jgi:hypothetical protein
MTDANLSTFYEAVKLDTLSFLGGKSKDESAKRMERWKRLTGIHGNVNRVDFPALMRLKEAFLEAGEVPLEPC